MKNDRISPKERGLLKGAVRRVFSRSDLRKQALDKQTIKYTDPSRPRVKKWSLCPICTKPTPSYLMQVDHLSPIIPIDSALEHMSWDDVINRTWCVLDNLEAKCVQCHKEKSSWEAKERRRLKKERSKK